MNAVNAARKSGHSVSIKSMQKQFSFLDGSYIITLIRVTISKFHTFAYTVLCKFSQTFNTNVQVLQNKIHVKKMLKSQSKALPLQKLAFFSAWLKSRKFF